MKQLVAVIIESDQGGTFYHDVVIINDYASAVNYEKQYELKYNYSHYTEYYEYPEGTDLEKVLADIEEYDEIPHNYLDFHHLRDVCDFFEIEEPTYSDGTVAVVGDKVLVNSDDFSWGLFAKSEMPGIVTSVHEPYYIELALDGFTHQRKLRLAHHLVKKNYEDNNTESNNG